VTLTVQGPEPADLYVAYDALAIALPTWLRAGWSRIPAVIPVNSERVVHTMPLGSAPCTIAWLEYTGEPPLPPPRLLVADAGGELLVLDPAELLRVALGDPAADADEVVLARLPVGAGACQIALLTAYQHPDWPAARMRSMAFVACYAAGQVAVVDLDELESLIAGNPLSPDDVVQRIDVGRGVVRVSLTPDQHEAQVLNLLDRSITRIDLGAGQVVETQPAGLPHELVQREIDRVRAAGIRTRVIIGGGEP
jgi:hypothetical protein